MQYLFFSCLVLRHLGLFLYLLLWDGTEHVFRSDSDPVFEPTGLHTDAVIVFRLRRVAEELRSSAEDRSLVRSVGHCRAADETPVSDVSGVRQK